LHLLAIALAAGIGIGLVAWAQRGGQPTAATDGTLETPPPQREDEAKVAPGDWPQWRGPNRDGVVLGVPIPEKWPETLTEEWRVEVGEGVASPVLAGGRLYVFARQKENEILLCLDAGGKEIWRSEPCPAPYSRGPSEGNFPLGPRSTPTVADGRVYTLGLSGVLSCRDARTGQRLWRQDCKPPPAPGAHDYGGTSPLVADGLCIVHVGDGRKGGLTAFDARTGDVRWCYADGHSPVSGSPILADLAGGSQVVTFYHGDALGVSALTGRKLWEARSPGPGQPHTTPVRYRDLLILANILQPLRALRLEQGDNGITVREVWKATGLPLGYSSPVLAGDLLFGMSSRKNGCFFCLDANSGATLWESAGGQGDYASLLNAGSVWLALTEKGRLIVVKPGARAFEPIAEYHVSNTDTHAHPVFLGDRVLIKDASTLRSFRIQPEAGRR
jgi:outer membrane protein assembly factor BamB